MDKRFYINFGIFLGVIYVLGGINDFFILKQPFEAYHLILPALPAFVLSIAYTRHSMLMDNLEEGKSNLEKSQKEKGDLMEINESLEVFAHTVSHDLKSPLYAFSVLITILEKDLENENYDHANATMVQLRNANGLMRNLIDKVLDYSKQTNFEIKYEKIILNDLIEDVSKGFSLTSDVNINVRADMLEIFFSEVALKQILNNLFENSIKYCDKETCEILVECISDETFITLRVSDNGPGIPEEYYKEIFRPFNRINKGSKIDGVGIGLATVKKIAERTGGGVSVKSIKGEGTQFSVIIKKVILSGAH
ncbi:MAG: HAMP domain-containing histidine kinase [Flavobacteriales bacterium]|nr:HAMP domain-containing histidine kinase [Flavobacteriales bacterium]